MVNPNLFVPGVRVKLIALTTAKTKLNAALIGLKPGEYLITEHPTIRGLPAHLPSGTDWMANFVHKGQLVSFSTSVLGLSRHPTALVFLTYPKSVEMTDLRHNKRFPVQIKGLLIPEAQGADQDAAPSTQIVIRDLSSGGCQLVSLSRVEPGELVELILYLPDDQQISGLTAEVVSCRQLSGRFLISLNFAPALTKDSYIELSDFIKKIESMPLRF